MIQTLTRKQQAVYRYLVRCIRAHGRPPSVRDVGKHFRMSENGAQKHLDALKRKRHIRREPGSTARTITLSFALPVLKLVPEETWKPCTGPRCPKLPTQCSRRR